MSNARANSFVLVQTLDPSTPDIVRYDQFVLQLFKQDTYREMLYHATVGVVSEAGELADAIKEHLAYGKVLDKENVREEIGDLRFFIQALQNILEIPETEVLQDNADKLAKRYKDLRYSDAQAIERADKQLPPATALDSSGT